MARLPLSGILSTTAGMGIILKPREFQHIVLTQLGRGNLADDLGKQSLLFPRTEERELVEMSPGAFMPALARLLLPLMATRSALGPLIEGRVVMGGKQGSVVPASSHNSGLLRKIGAAYNGYRQGVMSLVTSAQPLLASTGESGELCKMAAVATEELFTPLSVAYLSQAYFNDLPFGDLASGMIEVPVPAFSQRGEGFSPQ